MHNLRNVELRGMLIVILGPVGVGKSTITNALVFIFNKKNVRVRKTYIKSFHGPSYVLWYIISGLLGLPKSNAPWYILPMHGYTSLARVLTVISAYMDSLLSLPLKIILAKLLSSLGYIVISEEYLHTTFFDYLYSYRALNIKRKFYTVLPLHIIYSLGYRYRPDFVIVLDADLETVSKRWGQRGYGDPQLKYVLLLRWFLKQHYLPADVVLDTSNMNPARTLITILTIIVRELH